MLKIIIIEDEKPILDTIIEIVEKHCSEIEILGTAQTITSASEIIQNSKPDLVLLDINLPDGTSFELLEKLGNVDFKIIFITAFEEYAVKAIKLSAIDYLVKPIDPIELIQALDKAKEMVHKESNEIKLNALLTNINEISEKPKKIVLKTAENIYLIDVKDIIRCESDGAYTKFFIND
jgi:two-component system LytT family response regulator